MEAFFFLPQKQPQTRKQAVLDSLAEFLGPKARDPLDYCEKVSIHCGCLRAISNMIASPMSSQPLVEPTYMCHIAGFAWLPSWCLHFQKPVVSLVEKKTQVNKSNCLIVLFFQDWALESDNGGCPVNIMTPGAMTFHSGLRTPFFRLLT